MTQDTIDIAIRLGAALTAGSLIGLERSIHGRPAGFRTHALVCLASALLMLVTAYQWEWLGVTAANEESFRTDPTRMAQGIMTGIGFLGAGVIFKEGLTVRGLTTAASIWITSALGILYGVGFLSRDTRYACGARHARCISLDRGPHFRLIFLPTICFASPRGR